MTFGNRKERRRAKATRKLVIVISPAYDEHGKRKEGFFEARLDGEERVLCVSRTPFLDSARVLLAEGINPKTNFNMRHAGKAFESFKDPISIAKAASLTVKGSRFVPYKPSPEPTAGATDEENRPKATHDEPDPDHTYVRGCGTGSPRASKRGA